MKQSPFCFHHSKAGSESGLEMPSNEEYSAREGTLQAIQEVLTPEIKAQMKEMMQFPDPFKRIMLDEWASPYHTRRMPRTEVGFIHYHKPC